MQKLRYFILTGGLALLSVLPAMAQDAAAEEVVSFTQKYSNEILWLLIGIMLVVILGVILVMTMLMLQSVNDLRKDIRRAKGMEVEEEGAVDYLWDKINRWIQDSVPVEKEKDIEFDHAYDGIRELDNNLPPWWTALFYVTIAFAVVYMVHYHVAPIKFIGEGLSSTEQYEVQMAKAEAEKAEYLEKMANKVNESNVEVLTEPSALSSGKGIYMSKCMTCHGEQGQGGAGPNLTDPYWIHGGSIKDVFTTVKYGVSGKAMREWQSLLTPLEMQEVSSYVLSLQGTNPPGAKDPEGDLYKPEESESGAPADTTMEAGSDTLDMESAVPDSVQEAAAPEDPGEAADN